MRNILKHGLFGDTRLVDSVLLVDLAVMTGFIAVPQ